MSTTPAEFSTLRRMSGLSRDEVADMLYVQTRTVKHWERPGSRVPGDAVAALRHAVDAVEVLTSWLLAANPTALPLALLDSDHRKPFQGVRRGTWDAAVARCVQTLPSLRVVHFDADSFAAYALAQPSAPSANGASQLARWSTLQVEAQALPHTSDLPTP